MKKLIITLTLIILCSCSKLGNAPDALKPMPWLFKQVPENAPNKYKIGWKHGCESGLSSMTNSFYGSFYKFRQNKALLTDRMYYRTWKDTYDFCRHYAYGTIRQSDIRRRLPNDIPRFMATFMGTHNIIDHGLLQLWGPGNQLMPFQNFGGLGGNLGTPVGAGSSVDYSDDYAFDGKGKNPIMNWDFNR